LRERFADLTDRVDAPAAQQPVGGRALGFWDRRVVPVARALERRRKPPFGQSVLGVSGLS
jgi:hypothetical protein